MCCLAVLDDQARHWMLDAWPEALTWLGGVKKVRIKRHVFLNKPINKPPVVCNESNLQEAESGQSCILRNYWNQEFTPSAGVVFFRDNPHLTRPYKRAPMQTVLNNPIWEKYQNLFGKKQLYYWKRPGSPGTLSRYSGGIPDVQEQFHGGLRWLFSVLFVRMQRNHDLLLCHWMSGEFSWESKLNTLPLTWLVMKGMEVFLVKSLLACLKAVYRLRLGRREDFSRGEH